MSVPGLRVFFGALSGGRRAGPGAAINGHAGAVPIAAGGVASVGSLGRGFLGLLRRNRRGACVELGLQGLPFSFGVVVIGGSGGSRFAFAGLRVKPLQLQGFPVLEPLDPKPLWAACSW